MDIGAGNSWPSSALSNFAPHPFVFRGVECNSMEGLLQSFKFDKPHIQVEVCKLVGKGAKYRGKNRNAAWKKSQTLWWNGEPMKRGSQLYQDILDEAYECLAMNDGFKKALLATKDAKLTHSIGHNKESETVLTEKEFVSRLTKIRRKLNDAISL